MLWKIAHLWILSWLFHVLPNKMGDFPVPGGQFQHQVTETVGMMEPCEPPHFGPMQNCFRCFRLYWEWFSVGFTTLHFWGDHSPRVWLATPVTKKWCNNMGTGCPRDFCSISPGWFVQFLGCSSSIDFRSHHAGGIRPFPGNSDPGAKSVAPAWYQGFIQGWF